MNDLLPNAVNMFLNGETKKHAFTIACASRRFFNVFSMLSPS